MRAHSAATLSSHKMAARRRQGLTIACQGARRWCSAESPGGCSCSTLVPLVRFRCVSGVCTRYWCAPETVPTPQNTRLGFPILEPSRKTLLAVSGVLQAGLAPRSCSLFGVKLVRSSCLRVLLLSFEPCAVSPNLVFTSRAS